MESMRFVSVAVLILILPYNVMSASSSSSITTLTAARGSLRSSLVADTTTVDYLGHTLRDDMNFYVVFLSSIGALVFCSLLFVAIIQICRKSSVEINPEKVRKGITTFSQQGTQYNEEDFLQVIEKPVSPPRRKIKIKVNKMGGFSTHSSSFSQVILPPLKEGKL